MMAGEASGGGRRATVQAVLLVEFRLLQEPTGTRSFNGVDILKPTRGEEILRFLLEGGVEVCEIDWSFPQARLR